VAHYTSKARYSVVTAFDYLTAGREYDVEFRSNSKSVDVRRTDGSGIGTYLPVWQFKQAIGNGSLVQVAA